VSGLGRDAEIADGLREIARRLDAVDPADPALEILRRRLLAVADSAKRDSAGAVRRIRRLLADLDTKQV